MNNMRPHWLRKFYQWVIRDRKKEAWAENQAREVALRTMLQRGIEIGKKQVPSTVIEKRVCRLHPMVLLNEIGPGHYVCMLCREERNTDKIQQARPMDIYNEARRTGAGSHTATLQVTARLTRDLRKWQADQQQLFESKGETK